MERSCTSPGSGGVRGSSRMIITCGILSSLTRPSSTRLTFRVSRWNRHLSSPPHYPSVRPMDAEQQLRALADTLAPRTAQQYKLYQTKYIQWCRAQGLVRTPTAQTQQTQTNNVYADVVVTSPLAHWFILANYVCAPNASLGPSALRKIFSALRLLYRICKIYDPAYPFVLNNEYLEAVVRLHVNAQADQPNHGPSGATPLVTVSANLWSSHAPGLSDKFFRGGLEKLRFLVDFHVQQYWHLQFSDRAQIKMGDLFARDDVLLSKRNVTVEIATSDLETKSATPATEKLALLAQNAPWACPLVTLAAYFYLRFYGASKRYRGDGFPDLLDEMDEWAHLPLVRGKSLDKYPREETVSNYYAEVFRYCHLPYKRREYFHNRGADNCQYPALTADDATQLHAIGKGAQSEYFPDDIPLDFLRQMNRYPLNDAPIVNRAPKMPAVPRSLEVQIFPEIEEYLRKLEHLSERGRKFLEVMLLLRARLLYAMPLINHFFPEHDLFADSIFQTPEFQSYFEETINGYTLRHELENFNPMPNFAETHDPGPLARPPNSREVLTLPEEAVSDQASVLSYLRDQTFQFVQYQTATNFHMLISLLTKVFEKLETKKSNREYIIHQLNALENTLKNRIAASSPQELKKEYELNVHAARLPGEAQSDNSDIDNDQGESPDSQSNGDDDAALPEEFHTLVAEIIDFKLRQSTDGHFRELARQVDRHLQEQVKTLVRDEIRSQLSQLKGGNYSRDSESQSQLIPAKRERELSVTDTEEATFNIQADLNDIEDVILEWFTPNPNQNNYCIHSMNKDFGREWRTKNAAISALYRQRKTIVEFYIFLVNAENKDRYEAVSICERLRGNRSLEDYSNWLRDQKRANGNSYAKLLSEEATGVMGT
ncbi:LAMI_0F11452g1_1 [Lachancea mirantina]|uniref:LAMI_0F11452g1_1 n=1 Tax=Lachancea mirantina TaxID=1230905 RepID=A0A1G4K2R2_9SACH|nr:LAMI_0F11452g1_1 [Lachancea mirantina]